MKASIVAAACSRSLRAGPAFITATVAALIAAVAPQVIGLCPHRMSGRSQESSWTGEPHRG